MPVFETFIYYNCVIIGIHRPYMAVIRMNKMKDNIKEYTITKKLAKQGDNSILVIPKDLKEDLKPGMLVKVIFNVLRS